MGHLGITPLFHGALGVLKSSRGMWRHFLGVLESSWGTLTHVWYTYGDLGGSWRHLYSTWDTSIVLWSTEGGI